MFARTYRSGGSNVDVSYGAPYEISTALGGKTTFVFPAHVHLNGGKLLLHSCRPCAGQFGC